jgi:hypothetical protein
MFWTTRPARGVWGEGGEVTTDNAKRLAGRRGVLKKGTKNRFFLLLGVWESWHDKVPVCKSHACPICPSAETEVGVVGGDTGARVIAVHGRL